MMRVLLLGLAFGLVMRASADWTAQDRDALGEIDDNVRFLKNQNEEDFSKLLWQLTKSRVDNTGESYSNSGNGPTIRRILLDISNGVASSNQLSSLLYFLSGRNDGDYSKSPFFTVLQTGVGPTTPDHTVQLQSLKNFLSLTMGSFVESSYPGMGTWENAFLSSRDYANENGFQGAGFNFFTVWLAEAQRRLITNQLDFAAFDQRPWTNGIPVSESSGGSEEGNRLAVSGTAAETNKLVSAIDDFQAPSGGQLWSGDLFEAPRWTLTGSQSDPVVFSGSFGSRGSFDRSALSMELKIPFSRFGGTLRFVTSFMVAVGTACVCISIIRHEVDYWTTLGGSAT